MRSSRIRAAAAAFSIAILGLTATPFAASAAAHSDKDSATGDAKAAGLKAASAQPDRQAALVAGEDQRLTAALVAGRPSALHPTAGEHPYRLNAGALTLVLTQRRAPYSLDDL